LAGEECGCTSSQHWNHAPAGQHQELLSPVSSQYIPAFAGVQRDFFRRRGWTPAAQFGIEQFSIEQGGVGDWRTVEGGPVLYV
jgi:hypothetical protein